MNIHCFLLKENEAICKKKKKKKNVFLLKFKFQSKPFGTFLQRNSPERTSANTAGSVFYLSED